MYVIALHHLPPADDAQVRALASALGLSPVEARGRLAVPDGGPTVVARRAGRAEADALAAVLVGSGFTALVLDSATVETDAQRFVARRFSFRDDALCGETPRGDAGEVAFTDVRLLVRATAFRVETTTETTTVRKFSPGRALMTGGVMMSKSSETTQTKTEDARSGCLFVIQRSAPSWVLGEGTLFYEGLGDELQPTRLLNFARLCERMRACCPAARYDGRFVPRAGLARLLGPGLDPESYLDLAVAILSASEA